MRCRECTRNEEEGAVFVPKHFKKGIVCYDCYNDNQRIVNRKSRAIKARQENLGESKEQLRIQIELPQEAAQQLHSMANDTRMSELILQDMIHRQD